MSHCQQKCPSANAWSHTASALAKHTSLLSGRAMHALHFVTAALDRPRPDLARGGLGSAQPTSRFLEGEVLTIMQQDNAPIVLGQALQGPLEYLGLLVTLGSLAG